ncbi:ABC transporter ATP-binding protein [Jiulongibacter sp. NS-SX5]|uniref:ABC transporter ATP-binding protein n=1 Tax=Jiulongibacter sp. NS-SX5 TaxID=3463854 RepID=UPI004059D3D2
MVLTKELTFTYPNIDFHFPDITCPAGEVLIISGKSGKGKTTLLHLLGGLLRPKSGSVVIGDTDITGLSDRGLDQFRGDHIGIIFQQSHYIAALTVLENLELVANQSHKNTDFQSLLDALDMGDTASKLPENLSLGQQQRLSIARSLINNPLLLLADEPTSSLDDENCDAVAQLLKAQAEEKEASLIIVTHDQRLKDIFPNHIEL